MTTPASDLMLSTLPILQTPALDAAVRDYTGVMGFEVVQHVRGVLAVLRSGGVRLYLWQCGTDPQNGREQHFKPGRHRVAVVCAFDAYANLMYGLKKKCSVSPTDAQNHALHRLGGPPRLQPWGAWEFSLTDGDGNVLHLVQQVVTCDAALPKIVNNMPSREVLPGLRRKL